ncbi:MAG: zinc-ribbon domain-containing protein [Clostridia bacterium]|nr:zinc-ribbon domain-containing protein [Clostridia bacterium]
MAFFDDIGKSINSMTQSARKTAEVAKIQHQITQKQAEFDSLYHQIGQLYYSCHQRGLQPDESIAALCNRVTATAQEIDKLNAEIDRIRNVRRCPVCGNAMELDSRFCSKCGAKLENEPAEQPAAAPEQPAEESAPEKDVYINWPEAKPDTAPEDVDPFEETASAAEPEPTVGPEPAAEDADAPAEALRPDGEDAEEQPKNEENS